MKRKATLPPAGNVNGPKAQRTSYFQDDENPPDGFSSEAESLLSENSQPNPSNGTQLASRSRKVFPSDLKTRKCTFPGCDKSFNRPCRLEAHMRSHTGDRVLKCDYPDCDKSYTDKKHLTSHINNVHLNKRPVCDHPGCNKVFTNASHLKRHKNSHKAKEALQCRGFPPCEQVFRKQETLERHIRAEHLHTTAYPCEHMDDRTGNICNAGFDNAVLLKRHQERAHGEICFWCDECGPQQDEAGEDKHVGFPTLALLQAHVKKNHNKQVNCAFCGLSCDDKAALEQHIESEHSKSLEERRNVACTWPDCPKVFTRKSNMYAHVRSAHEGLRFVCGDIDLSGTSDLEFWSQLEGCGASFFSKAALENHVRYEHLKYQRPGKTQPATKREQPGQPSLLEGLTGVGEKTRRTIPCPMSLCNAKFSHNGELEEHLQSQHAIEQELLALGSGNTTWDPPNGGASNGDAFNGDQFGGYTINEDGEHWPAVGEPLHQMPLPLQEYTNEQGHDKAKVDSNGEALKLKGLIDPRLF
ncbi:hypothetical protein F4804DRAFT_311429 [Jackrogersella minutella]|nr:hypothetical protein F4804DRAFT_311429 [Jackrogersella minutella]